MKRQNTSPSDGSFSGNSGNQNSTAGDAPTKTQTGHTGYQSPNDYTQYKQQQTQAGWDGSFVGIRIPSPLSSDGDGGGSQTSGLSGSNFSGFTNPGEMSGPAGPSQGPSNGNPTNGSFPGDGTGFDGFGRQNER